MTDMRELCLCSLALFSSLPGISNASDIIRIELQYPRSLDRNQQQVLVPAVLDFMIVQQDG